MQERIVVSYEAGSTFRTLSRFVIVGIAVSLAWPIARAQVRGVYPAGMNATNSGVTPESGFTYSNLFVLFSRDEKKDAAGNVVATGQNSILMDLNTFAWVKKKEIAPLGGAVFSATATLPIANNSLSSDIQGSISGGGGFADSFYQPVIVGWRKRRADLRAIYDSWRRLGVSMRAPMIMSVPAIGHLSFQAADDLS